MTGQRTWALACLCALLLASAGRPGPPQTSEPTPSVARGDVAAGQLILLFDPAVAEPERDAAVSARHGRTLRVFPNTDARLVALPPGASLLERAAAYATDPRIRYTEPNFLVRAAALPDDPAFTAGEQWALRNTGQLVGGEPGVAGADISATAAWDVTTGDPTIVVGLIDSGIAYDHPDLTANVWRSPAGWTLRGCVPGTTGYDAVSGDCDPRDDYGHGTAVAGVIGATGNNGIGVTGVNWRTSLLALRALDSQGNGTVASVVDAIEFALEARQAGVNLRVLNNSWLSADSSALLRESIRRAGEQGILVVTAAGNARSDLDREPLYPASFDLPNLLVVTFVNHRDESPPLANYGPRTVHLAAPGAEIYTTCLRGSTPPTCAYDYGSASGSSLAAGFASGAAALTLAAPGGATLTPGQLIARLVGCGDHLANLDGRTVSGHRLNAARAVAGCAKVTVLPHAGGKVMVDPPGPTYAYGDSVTVTATADSGAAFSEWLVNGVTMDASNPFTVTVDQALTVRARFKYHLDTSWSTGGTVRLDPAAANYDPGATVSASAIPATGFRFAGWRHDGVDAGTTTPLTVTMDAPHTLYAAFEAVPPPPAPTPTTDLPPPIGPTPTPTPVKPMPGIGSWSTWQSHGGALIDAPAAAAFNGRLYVFARGVDNGLYVKSSADAVYWTEWQGLGGVLSAAPAAAAAGDRLHVLARGADNALYIMSTQDGVTFTDWRYLGGVLTAPPAAAATAEGALLIFASGADNALYVMKSVDGERFDTWSRVGGTLTTGPAAASFLGQVYLFVRGSDGALYETVTSDGVAFSDWRSRGGVLTAAPAAAAATPTGGLPTLYLLARGSDGALYERHSLDGDSYTGWRSLGGKLVGPPAATGAIRLVAFARWLDNALYERHTPP